MHRRISEEGDAFSAHEAPADAVKDGSESGAGKGKAGKQARAADVSDCFSLFFSQRVRTHPLRRVGAPPRRRQEDAVRRENILFPFSPFLSSRRRGAKAAASASASGGAALAAPSEIAEVSGLGEYIFKTSAIMFATTLVVRATHSQRSTSSPTCL
jgi:hypothetical protein